MTSRNGRRARQKAALAAKSHGLRMLSVEHLEQREVMAASSAGHMAIGMNLQNIVDWSPAWTFTDAFQASRGWITHAVNTATGQMTWDVGQTNPVPVDGNGNVRELTTFTNAAGQTMRRMAGTLMFRELDGAYPGGTYRAEWEGTGRVSFGMDARVVSTGRTPAGINHAELAVTPGNGGIYLRIEETSPTDPVRDFRVWMPEWQGRSFVGERWQPGAAFSPFHPLFRERLAPFGVIRFMQAQETNTSDIRSWSDRRDARDIRQSSGLGGSASEPVANGMSVEHMVRLANDQDADPWFNMPHMADDDFVRNFATYVRDNLEPGRRAYVEWSNEIWNFAWGFEATQWVVEQTRLPANEGLSHWQIAGREAKRDLDIWTQVFAGQTDRLVRVAGGFAANDWVTARIVENMGGSFDAIAIAPYFSPTSPQRSGYTSDTTVAQILDDCEANITVAVGFATAHERLARDWSTRLGRDIRLVAYEGGHHLDPPSLATRGAFYEAANHPRMGDLYRDYLRRLDATGMDLYVDYVFTGRAGAGAWGDMAKIHRMDEPLDAAWRYRAVVSAADGSLWNDGSEPPPPTVGVSVPDALAAEAGRESGSVRFTRTGGNLGSPLTVSYVVSGSARSGEDFAPLSGTITFAAGAATADLTIVPLDDVAVEPLESVVVTLSAGAGYQADSSHQGTVQIVSDDVVLPTLTLSGGSVAEGHAGFRQIVFVVGLSAPARTPVTAQWRTVDGTALAGSDYRAGFGRIVIRPGQTSTRLTVLVRGDRTIETDETFAVRLTSVTGATSAVAEAVGTIRDDDRMGSVFASLGGAISAGTSSRTGRRAW